MRMNMTGTSARAQIGDTYLGLGISIAGKGQSARRASRVATTSDLPARTPLILRLEPNFDGKSGTIWRDDDDGKLESKIGPIAAAIIAASEAKLRRGLLENEERAKQALIDAEKRRQLELEERNKQRLEHLKVSGELLRQAEDIRVLVQRVGRAIAEGAVGVDASVLQSCEKWALAQADRIDPVLSGQFMSHLAEPQ